MKEKTNFQTKTFALLLIAIALLLGVLSVWGDSVIVDEVPHIGAGYSYITQGDYRLNPEHPPLVKDLAAIPLLFQKIDKNSLFSQKAWTEDLNGQWQFGRYLLFTASPDPIQSTRLAKLPVFIFYIFSAWLIFNWSRKRYGDGAGLLALIIFLFSPTIMAHARFVTTDMAAGFGVLFATYFYLQYLEHGSKKNFWLAGVFFGIALLTKFSAVLLVPYFLLLAVIWEIVKEKESLTRKSAHAILRIWKTVLIMIVGFLIIVWPVYFIHTVNEPPQKQYQDTKALMVSYGNRSFADPVIWASDKPILRGAAKYGLGLLMVNQRAAGGNQIYFQGNVVNSGGPSYFPIVYFIKEPLAWWGMVIIAILGIIANIKNKTSNIKNRYNWEKNFTEAAMLLWLIIYWVISVRSSLNIGVRHLIPAFPFMIILVSGQIANIYKKLNIKYKKEAALALSILVGWYVYENINIYPYYLTYFNQSVGGPQEGYKIVVDSNLDWGQDLGRLAKFVEKNQIAKIDLDYFGWADQTWYLKNRLTWINSGTYAGLEDFKFRNTSDGWIAVSATFLMGSQGEGNGNYRWLRQQIPVKVIGNSIFVYHLK